MHKQLKYEWRAGANLRVASLGGYVILSVIMAVLFGYLRIMGFAGEILGVVLASCAFTALLVISLFVDVRSLNRLFKPPLAYMDLLTPTPAWKQLLSRILMSMAQDIVFLLVGLVCLLWQIEFLAKEPILSIIADGLVRYHYWYEGFLVLLYALFYYFFFVLAVYFATTLTRTILANVPGRNILSVLAFFACLYLYPLLDIVLYPLNDGSVELFNMAVIFTLDSHSIISVLAYFLFAALKCAGLFFLTSKLIERKLNV